MLLQYCVLYFFYHSAVDFLILARKCYLLFISSIFHSIAAVKKKRRKNMFI